MGAVLDNSNVQGRDSDEPDSRPVYIPERQAMNPTILRGELYFANLDPCVGSEQGGTRPVLIIQNNIGNQHSDTTIVAAITGRRKPGLPTHILVPKSIGLREDSTILLEQLRTIDEMRLGQKIGALSMKSAVSNPRQSLSSRIAPQVCNGSRMPVAGKDSGYEPQPGDTIFFDWQVDGIYYHVGVVESCDGAAIHTVEGDSGDACQRNSYGICGSSILGFGELLE